MVTQLARSVQQSKLSRTKWGVDQRELSNRTRLADKTVTQLAKTVQQSKLSRTNRRLNQRELSNIVRLTVKTGTQLVRTVQQSASRGQIGDSIKRNSPIERLSRTKRGLHQQELSNIVRLTDKSGTQLVRTVQQSASRGQNGDSISKNCPIGRLSRTKRGLNQLELSNRTRLADKTGTPSARTVQQSAYHGQNGDSISRNCPIERLSRTKWRLNHLKLSNKTPITATLENSTQEEPTRIKKIADSNPNYFP